MNEPLITLVGNLVADPELRYTPNGAAVANFTIAQTPKIKDQSGNWVDGESLFARCSVWREFAENVAETLTKGTRVVAQARVKSRSYETKEGEKRTITEYEIDAIGPDLRYANAKVNRIQRHSNAGDGGGWSADYGRQQAHERDMRGGTTSDDPWATGSTNDGLGTEAPF